MITSLPHFLDPTSTTNFYTTLEVKQEETGEEDDNSHAVYYHRLEEEQDYLEFHDRPIVTSIILDNGRLVNPGPQLSVLVPQYESEPPWFGFSKSQVQWTLTEAEPPPSATILTNKNDTSRFPNHAWESPSVLTMPAPAW
jgi:hypothetical protein